MDNISSLRRHSYPKDPYPWTTEKKTNAKGEMRYGQENQDLKKVVDRLLTELRDVKNELAIHQWGIENLSGIVRELSSKPERLEKRTGDRRGVFDPPPSKNSGGKATRTEKKMKSHF